jgi:hypothetical protein
MNNSILGTIISSVLTYDQLCSEIHENPAFNSGNSSFAPCDGRTITHSRLHECVPAMHNAPDLRGKFQRGLNQMYGDGLENLPFNPDTHGDPEDNRVVNTYQADAVVRHNHPATVNINGNIIGSNRHHDVEEGDQKYNSDPTFFGGISVTIGNNENGEIETRPRNIAVYFYIKIN